MLLCCTAVVFLSTCRIARIGREDPEKTHGSGGGEAVNNNAPVVQPQRQTAEGQSWNLTLNASGKVLETLTLRLDYFPAPRPDGVSVPTCYDEIAQHLVVGRLYCGSNGNNSMDVIVAQVNQRCYTATEGRKIEAKSALNLSGCQGAATLKTIKFEPDLKLEVSSKNAN